MLRPGASFLYPVACNYLSMLYFKRCFKKTPLKLGMDEQLHMLVYMHMITYPWHYPDAALAYLC